MKVTIDIKPYDLEEDDTICGYRLKDVCLIAKCMEKAGVDKEDVAKFVKEFQNATDIVRKEFDEVFKTMLGRNKYGGFGGKDE